MTGFVYNQVLVSEVFRLGVQKQVVCEVKPAAALVDFTIELSLL